MKGFADGVRPTREAFAWPDGHANSVVHTSSYSLLLLLLSSCLLIEGNGVLRCGTYRSTAAASAGVPPTNKLTISLRVQHATPCPIQFPSLQTQTRSPPIPPPFLTQSIIPHVDPKTCNIPTSRPLVQLPHFSPPPNLCPSQSNLDLDPIPSPKIPCETRSPSSMPCISKRGVPHRELPFLTQDFNS